MKSRFKQTKSNIVVIKEKKRENQDEGLQRVSKKSDSRWAEFTEYMAGNDF